MTNDAKLGLVLGVAIVLVIGLVFFRSEPPLAQTGVPSASAPSADAPSLPAAHLTHAR